jgi:hypothetical protein
MVFLELRNNKITEVKSGIERYNEIELQSDPVLDFVENFILVESELSDADKLSLRSGPFEAKAIVYTDDLWPKFFIFVGQTKLTKRGFENRLSTILLKKNNVKKEKETKGNLRNKRYYTGVYLLND